MIKLTVNAKQVRYLTKGLRLKRKTQNRAILRDVINSLAWGIRDYAYNYSIPRTMINRNSWARKSLYITRATNKSDIKQMRAIAGARKKWGGNKDKQTSFYGLAEQEVGGKVWGKAYPTAESRGGSFKNKVKPSLTFKGMLGKRRAKEIDNGKDAIGEIRRHFKRHGRSEPFRVNKGNPKFRAGTYKAVGNLKLVGEDIERQRRRGKRRRKKGSRPLADRRTYEVKMMKSEEQKTVSIKPRKWLLRSIKQKVTPRNIMAAFAKAYKKHTKPLPRKK